MSERGQKIFKIVVWIIIGLFVIYNIAKLAFTIYFTGTPAFVSELREVFG